MDPAAFVATVLGLPDYTNSNEGLGLGQATLVSSASMTYTQSSEHKPQVRTPRVSDALRTPISVLVLSRGIKE